MPQLGNLSVSVTADLTGLKNGLAQAQAQMRGASVEAERMGSTMETAHGRAGTAAGRAGAQHLQAGEAAKRGGRAAEDAGGSWEKFGGSLKRVGESTGTAREGIAGVVSSMGLVQVGAILAGASLTAFATHAVVSAEEAGQAAYEMSEKFGILPTQASAWVAAGGQLGVSAASMSSGFKFLAKNLEAINLKTTANQAKELTAAQKAVEAAAKQHDTAEQHLADTQAKLAGKTHLTASEQIALRDAQQKVTDSTDKLNAAQGRLSVAQAGLDPKSVTARAALDSLGIKSEDAAGKIRPINDLLFEVSDKFQMMEDGPEKAGLAMKLFGKQGADLIPVLNAGRAGIEGLMAAGRASGAVQSPEQIEAAHRAYLAHMALNQAIAGVSNELGAALLPSFAQLADMLSKQVIPVVLRLVNEGLARLKQFLGDSGINRGILAASVAFGILVPVLAAVAIAAWSAVIPMLPFIAVGVALAGAAYLVITHWSQIAPILNRVREGLAPLHVIFDKLGRLWQETIIPGLRSLGVSMGPIGDEFKRAFAEWLPILQPIAAAVLDFYVKYWSVLIAAFQIAFPIAITYVVTAFKVLGQVIDLVAAVFRGDWGRVGQDFQNINNIMAEALHVVVVKIRQSIDWLGLEALRLLLAMKQGIEDLFLGLVHRTEDLIGVAFKAAVLNPVQNVHDETTRLMQQMADTLSGIWNGLKGVASSAWGGITGAIKGELRSIVGVINDFVKAANAAFGSFGLKLPTMDVPGLAAGGNLGSGRFASGGVLELASGGRVGAGFMTNGPSAIVGEGRAQFPEYVIPSDPAYRSNALSLMGSAAKAMGLAEGGLIPALADGGSLDGTIGGECVVFAEKMLGTYWPVAAAAQLTAYVNSQTAKAGEAAVFTGGPYGHVAIAEGPADAGGNFSVIDSNWVSPQTIGEHVMGPHNGAYTLAGFIDTGSGVPGGLAGVVGGMASGALDKIFDPANSAMKALPGVLGPSLGVGMLKSIEDGVKSRMASAASFAGAPTGHAAASGAHGDWLHAAEQIAGVGIDWDSGLSTIIEHESGWSNTAQNNTDINAMAGNPCVPLDSEILTQRGWLRHDSVRVGDLTLAFNPDTGNSEWTRINQVFHHEAARVIRIGHTRWHARVTPNHRWWSDTRGGEFVETQSFKRHHRLRLSAPANTGGGIDLSLNEVSVLAWILGDGNVSGNPELLPSDAHQTCHLCAWPAGIRRRGLTKENGLRVHLGKVHGVQEVHARSLSVAIYQAKPRGVESLGTLLAEVPHTVGIRQREGVRYPEHKFQLQTGWARSLLLRSRIFEVGPVAFVLSLSPAQRSVFVGAMIEAEGHHLPTSGVDFIRITQRDGELQEAIKLAVYLQGYRPSVGRLWRNAENHAPAVQIGVCRPHVMPQAFGVPESLGVQPVWCVETDLGTWTMRQDDQIMLTGNSRGLMQLTLSNQRAYGGITDDPVQQIVEGIRYIQSRYGGIGNVPGVRSVLAGGSYQPYDEGGLLPPGLSMAMNGTGASEHVFTAGQMRSFTRQEALLGKLLAVMQDRGAPIEQHFHGQAVDAAAARQMLSAAAWYSRVGRV